MSQLFAVGKVKFSKEHAKLVISNIIGGLGNQMFQYAAGLSLALSLESPFYLDIEDFESYYLHNGYELKNVFCCNAPLASNTERSKVLGWGKTRTVRHILTRPEFALFRYKSFVVEPHFHYWKDIKMLNGNIYLQGYWQSERYFFDNADSIRSEFTFCRPLSKVNVTVLEIINNSESPVSLHIRRGDYLSSSRANAEHGLCSLDYYRSAVSYIAERLPNPEFFIFSDDDTWAQNNLKLEYPCHYIDHNRGLESYNDMRLMSMCHHHIIANSSFSWWGAWLNPSSDKMVIAPKNWFANTTKSTQDLFPSGWIQI